MVAPFRSYPQSDKAFTLIELLVVIVIIGVIGSVGLAVGRSTTESGRTTRAKAEMGSLAAALESYRRHHGDYPQTVDPAALLQSLIGKRGPTGAATTSPSFVELEPLAMADRNDPFSNPATICVDPWGNAFCYAYRNVGSWSHPSYVLYSSGPDRAHAELPISGRIDDLAAANQDNVYLNR